MLMSIGCCIAKTGNIIEGIRFLEQSLSISKEIGDNLTEAKAYGNLGTLHIQTNNLKTAENNLDDFSALLKKFMLMMLLLVLTGELE